jgi:hypothetical protein
MANANITTIVTSLGLVTLDATQVNNFQDDVIFELARGAFGEVLAQVGAAFIAVTGGTATYALPAVASGARTPLVVCFDDFQLAQVRKDEAWAHQVDWRNSPGVRPIGYVQDPEDRVNFSLVPVPRRDGATIGGSTPFTFTQWPADNITVIFAATDVTFSGTTYDDLKLPIALEVLSRELGRDSDHQDKLASQVARALAQFFFEMFNPSGVLT